MDHYKIEKGKYLVCEPHFDYGCTDFPLKEIQVLGGNQQVWIAVKPEIAVIAGATHALMGTPDSKGRAVPKGGPAEQRRVWCEFWENIERMRIMFADCAQWNSRFTETLAYVLTTSERLSLPSSIDAVTWVNGDATLEKLGSVDWTWRFYIDEKAAPCPDAPTSNPS